MPVCLPIWLLVCPLLYTVSVWLHNKPAFMLERRGEGEKRRAERWFYSSNHIQSCRHTVSGHVYSLRHNPQLPIIFPLSRTPSLYLCFSLTNCFVIYVSFLKPLTPQAVVAMMDLSLCISQNYNPPVMHTHVQHHANTHFLCK